MTDKLDEFIPQRVLIVGYGDIGRRVARLCKENDIAVSGLARSPESAAGMQNDEVSVITADLDRPETLVGLQVAGSLVIYLAPPPRSGTTDPRMGHFLASLEAGPQPEKILYLSTSGVYGNRDGGTVTEETLPKPGVDRARRRLDAEQQLGKFCDENRIDYVILRVGGIYGPGRLPVKRIQDGIPIIHEQLAPKTNRIHADDLATICLAAARFGKTGKVYNVSDGCESNMTEYFFAVADHLGLPRPPTVDWDEAEKVISPGMLSYLRESRRMDNSRMINDLHVKLRYPDLKTGLQDIDK